jgi:hypothetical protein
LNYILAGAVMTILVLIGWVILSFVISGAAHERGRSAFGWFLFSICFSPLIAGLFLLLFPSMPSSIDDQALQGSVRRGQKIDRAILAERGAEVAPQKRGAGRWMFLLAAMMITAGLAAVGMMNMREATSTESEADKSTSNNGINASKAALDYSVIASWPCARYLKAYGTTEFSTITEPLVETISSRGDGLGSAVNIMSFVATECRLHETITIGQAVENLFQQQQHNRLPRIPIGGATNDQYVHAVWDAFDKWVHHEGPRPNFPPIERAATPPAPAPKSFGGRYCDAVMKNIEQRNQQARDFDLTLPAENPNSPKNPKYRPPSDWQILSCDETNDPNRVGGMLDTGGGTRWYFEASKSAYPFPSGGDAIRLAVCLEAIVRQDDILGVPACRSAGELRKICDTTPRSFKCDSAPDPRSCARRNAVCLAELGR